MRKTVSLSKSSRRLPSVRVRGDLPPRKNVGKVTGAIYTHRAKELDESWDLETVKKKDEVIKCALGFVFN